MEVAVAKPPSQRLAELLHRELRTAGTEARDNGATEDEVTADLTERLERIRSLNADGWRGRDAAREPGEPPPDDPADPADGP
jgi:hypothetical protein